MSTPYMTYRDLFDDMTACTPRFLTTADLVADQPSDTNLPRPTTASVCLTLAPTKLTRVRTPNTISDAVMAGSPKVRKSTFSGDNALKYVRISTLLESSAPIIHV